jgi:hypothetical protein
MRASADSLNRCVSTVSDTINHNKLGKLIAAGYQDLREVLQARLSGSQLRIWNVTRAGQPELAPGAAEFANSLAYPGFN